MKCIEPSGVARNGRNKPRHASLAAVLLFVCFTFGWLLQAVADEQGVCQTVDFYWHQSCPHCQRAHQFLAQLEDQNSQLTIHFYDIDASAEHRQRFVALNERYKVARPGVPTFYICNEIMIGFDRAESTGMIIRQKLGLMPPAVAQPASDRVTLPWLGEISVGAIGLPAFTLLIGLVDGVNPCAMWVLLFLLSILVNVHDRYRMVLIAGSFVLVSGLVYFLFMAAWLNIFMFIGWSRPLQIAVAVIALVIGGIHTKDFFAPHKGVSLSIPERVKPTLYQRLRAIVSARQLAGSMLAVVVLAVLVNLVELLCTAGLPVIYTHILTSYELSRGQYYAYLILYNLAYIFDDGLMVAIAVMTLNRYKLQARHGRWFKLMSGGVILLIGLLLLFAPGILHLSI